MADDDPEAQGLDATRAVPMTTFVLVHGAWHGAWFWFKVVPRLRAAGHEVVTFDLPAHGIDDTPPGPIGLSDYVDRTVEVIDAQSTPVILLGHSLGGVIISQVAEERPGAIDRLVYLAAFLPADGESLADNREPTSALEGNRLVDEEAGTIRIDEDALAEAFYNDCTEADIALGRSLHKAEPLAPMTEPVTLSEHGFGDVPRAYIHTERDRGLPLRVQESMRGSRTVADVFRLDSSHSPFLSMPDELVGCLTEIGDSMTSQSSKS